jgi:toxin ParE1/3/4
MNYTIDISLQAKTDLRNIYNYIANELLSPQTAANQIDRLEENIFGLEVMPFRFKRYDEEPWKSRGLHIMPVDKFVVLYIPNKQKTIVTILRVMYGGRNINEQLSL